ncbi:MAG: hypothetical protein JSS49_17730 [Planctomycetes bacterium]|nr:hypothetical protein [Planctomycetota bacterium]
MGILFAAASATLASVVIIGGVIAWNSPPADRWYLVFLGLVMVPASPLTFYGIRLPLDGLLRLVINDDSHRLVTFAARPMIEELFKLWPLMIPVIWKSTTKETRLWRALAIGLGFGIGEIWLLADIVFRNNPEVANQSVLSLTGFINERAMVCLIHGGLTAIALHTFGAGLPLAITLHAAGNLPFYLQEISAFGLAATTWTSIVRTWVLWYFFMMVAFVWTMAGGDFHAIWLLFGDATCPYCGTVYPRASLTWNLRVVHQDHCPRCKART